MRRGYFFGPGLHQLKVIVIDSFVELSVRLDGVKQWKGNICTNHPSKFITIPVTLFYVIALIMTYVFGGIWVAAFSVILSVILLIGMVVFFIFFSILWIADRLYLLLHSIHCRCPECHRQVIVPIFLCDQCNAHHLNLTPGPYGVFKRTCGCGHVMPTTVFNGRSKLQAICPLDYTPLVASSAQQIGIQLVGSTKSGKTTYLASFWHCFNEKLQNHREILAEYSPEHLFKTLESKFQSGDSFDSTIEENARMYSVVLEKKQSIPLQLSVYDIAGEAFSHLELNQQQEQFAYCEGIMFVVDPSDSPIMAVDCINLFIANFQALKGINASKIVSLPVALLITKADLFKKEIGPIKIRTTHNKNVNNTAEGEPIPTFDDSRNMICKEFLQNHGFSSVIGMLEGTFSDVQYYAVSAIGHEVNTAEQYEPWGVMEPITSILNKTKVWKNSDYRAILKGDS